MEKENWSNILERVQRVDPPPFLFTRIEARIATRSASRPSTSWVTATVLAMLLVLVVNTVLIVPGLKGGGRNNAGEGIALSMGIQINNQLYKD